MDNEYEPVEEFYAGKSVLVTGGTGFLGKVLIEKLVYSCPKLENVYVLVRNKRDVPSLERFHRILESKVFTRIRKEKPEYLEKIKFLNGDVTSCDLGLSDEDKAIVLDKVSIVFHLAATVRFNEPLTKAMKTNVEGTRNVIHFSQKMKDLRVFLYMSTAFCNVDKTIVEEVVYPPPMKIDDIYSFLKINGDSEEVVKEIIKDWPNTYAFTKAVTETLVAETSRALPTVVVRPSMVIAAMHEPIPGWIDSWMGPTLPLELLARGWIRYVYGNGDYIADVIPVDYVINATIVAAARYRRSKQVSVYNCTTSTSNTLTFNGLYSLYRKQSLKVGYNDLPLNTMVFTSSIIIYTLLSFIFHTIPAYFMDLVSILTMKSPKHIKLMRKYLGYLDAVSFFTSRNWYTTSTRLQELANDLDEMDGKKFPCNPTKLNWSEYVPVYFEGVVQFLVGGIKKATD